MITLLRTGDRPLEFEGELLKRVSTQLRVPEPTPAGPRARWHELELYRRAAGGFVAVVIYRSTWPDELAQLQAEVCSDLAAVATWLRACNPLGGVLGPPGGGPGSPQEARRVRLEKELRTRYDEALGRLLAAFPKSV